MTKGSFSKRKEKIKKKSWSIRKEERIQKKVNGFFPHEFSKSHVIIETKTIEHLLLKTARYLKVAQVRESKWKVSCRMWIPVDCDCVCISRKVVVKKKLHQVTRPTTK